MFVTLTYDERLRAPLRWWVQATMLVASLWLALVVATPAAVAWSVTVVAAAAAAALLLGYGNARIVVDDGIFRAGRAQIETRYLGRAEPLDKEQTRAAAGPEADARAFLLLRPYLSRSVRVRIEDPRDPTPYWLVSTRHPQRLAAALVEVAGSDQSTRLNAPNAQED